jgi:hypothetical protein
MLPRTRRILLVVGLLMAALGALVALGFILVPRWLVPLAEARVLDEARRHGVILVPRSIHFRKDAVILTDTAFSLVGVSGVRGRAAYIVIGLSGLSPNAITVTSVDTVVVGSAAELALSVGEWSERHTSAYALPVTASEVALRWSTAEADQPWFSVQHGQITRTGDTGMFSAREALLSGRTLGRMGAVWTTERSAVRIGLGETELKDAPIRAELTKGAEQSTLTLTLEPTDIRRLSEPLGVEIPLEQVSVSGSSTLLFDDKALDREIEGRLEMKLDGFVPPHPPELDGFVFGKATTFESSFVLSSDHKLVTLKDARVKAGSFVLTGQGSIQREATHARTLMRLRGNLACTALLGAAAESRLGRTIGPLVGAAARAALRGSVSVIVDIDADSRNLAQAKLRRTIGVGCGLKPLELPGLPPIEIPLPNLPTTLPTLPKLPRLEDVVGPAQKRAHDPAANTEERPDSP